MKPQLQSPRSPRARAAVPWVGVAERGVLLLLRDEVLVLRRESPVRELSTNG